DGEGVRQAFDPLRGDEDVGGVHADAALELVELEGAAAPHEVEADGARGEEDFAVGGDGEVAGAEGRVELGLELVADLGGAAGGAVVDEGGLAVDGAVPAGEGEAELVADLPDVRGDDDDAGGAGGRAGVLTPRGHEEGHAEDEGEEGEDDDPGGLHSL